jgi:hypothetical protein
MAKMSPADLARVNDLRRTFQKLYPNATANEVMVFHGWLMENHRDLLPPPVDGDTFQQLREELRGLWDKPQPSGRHVSTSKKAKNKNLT